MGASGKEPMNDMKQKIAEMARRYMPLDHAELFANEILAIAAPGRLEWNAVHRPTHQVVASFQYRDLCENWIKEVYPGTCEVWQNPPPTIETKAAEGFNQPRPAPAKDPERNTIDDERKLLLKAAQIIGGVITRGIIHSPNRDKLKDADALLDEVIGDVPDEWQDEEEPTIRESQIVQPAAQPVTRADMRRLAEAYEAAGVYAQARAIRETFKE